MPVMRTHADILAPKDDQTLAAELNVSIHTVRSWRQRNSIPSEHWKAIVASGRATSDELIDAAAAKSRQAA
jgi:hypothetical protein